MDTVIEIRDLNVRFFTYYGVVHAVNGVTFSVHSDETLGVVGESGSGKSVTGLSMMGLVEPPGYVTGGEILFSGRDLTRIPESDWLRLRGAEITMCFQNPMRALNPTMKMILERFIIMSSFRLPLLTVCHFLNPMSI